MKRCEKCNYFGFSSKDKIPRCYKDTPCVDKPKHPTPWTVEYRTYESPCGEQEFEVYVQDANGKNICVMLCDEDEAERIARLLAAAPELYNMLLVAKGALEELDAFGGIVGMCEQTLRKARGEE